jgi:transcriptional regulator with XRE-family HTH domain
MRDHPASTREELAGVVAELAARLDAMDQVLIELGALIRRLRTERHLSTRRLAVRSGLARSTVTRLEAGQLHPRQSTLASLAVGLDLVRCSEILDQLVAAAGAEMAPDTPGWQRYRRRRIRRGLRAGTIPVPEDVRNRRERAEAVES